MKLSKQKADRNELYGFYIKFFIRQQKILTFEMFLKKNKYMKRCFKCKSNLPLFMYHVDSSKYQRESAKGKCIECRKCAYKRINEHGGVMQRLDGKFAFVPMTKKELIKYILKK